MHKLALLFLLLSPALQAAEKASETLPPVVVHGPDPCLSCMEWVYHLMENGFTASFKPTADMAALKRQLGVPPGLESVLTAKIGRYFIEGHVPAEDIKLLLKEQPKARGLAVPGLPLGAPGYEGDYIGCEAGCTILTPGSSTREVQREMFMTLLVKPDGKTTIFARH